MSVTSAESIASDGTGKLLRILAFEAWDGGSHRAVRESIQRHASMDWHWLTLPPANWRWRLRLGATDLAAQAAGPDVLGAEWDAVFATSLVSLAELVALLPQKLAGMPRILYMHENQAAYPAAPGRGDERDAHAIATNITSMLAADRILWNSQWNLDSFMGGSSEMLRAAKGAVAREVLADILERSEVLWPPVEVPAVDDARVLHKASEAKERGLTLVVWPHRWEHDKGPGELLTIEQAQGEADRIGWILLGQQFDHRPAALEQLLESAGDRVVHAGHAARREYESWLRVADWVLSTATHEFFGIAVCEALLAGCLPWLPERLSYPELVPAGCIGRSPRNPIPDQAAMRTAIRTHLQAATAAEAVHRLESVICETPPLVCR
ncbi:MAG: DUF3524 domain-containing protein [Phycisphaerales bacterium]|nr:DUF3524 domain-containing protein [Phycisphaerales bacterium]MDP6890527.1 DUF3524 domain-containing protein [Phycisphaerales bacterium]